MAKRSGLVQPEPFLLRHLGDGDHGKSLVLPIPITDRALRIGFRWRSWCKIGPRQYRVVATAQFVDSYERITGGTADDLRERGIEIQGDLKAVQE